jgi:uncharacterized protein with PIN domain
MFKPHHSICIGTHKYKGCGNKGLIMTNSRQLCTVCESRRKRPKTIVKQTSKQRIKIQDNKAFYARFIENHPTKCCDECGEPIHNPTGSNVSHVVAGGTNPAVYDDPRNAFLLCQRCENVWTSEDRTKMKLWTLAQSVRTEVLNDHYVKPIIKK